MNKNNINSFRLGNASVFPSRNEMEAHGQINRLQPKVMEVLCYLADNFGRVIPKEELIENVWRGKVVTDGSVQKSINLLRKALLEALGEQDVIVHYSKKGYELQIPPVFFEEDKHSNVPIPLDGWRANFNLHRARWLGGLAVATLVVAGASYGTLRDSALFLSRDHVAHFDRVQGYTSELGHERNGEPHPDNRHLAYVRDTFDPSNPGGSNLGDISSELVVRDHQGADWKVAQTTGKWLDLAWSPSGQQLAVVELIREEGLTSAPDFYSAASRLYNIHVYSLDLEARQVLEKHRLSQWQGRINSVTWWNDGAIELVARQGESSVNQRYRYGLQAQRLEVVESPDFIANPLLTRIKDGISAIASLRNDGTRIDFISPSQSHIRSLHLPHPVSDLSWIPDGSGILAFSEEDAALSIAYRNGDVLAMPFEPANDTRVSRLRYGAEGQRLFFTQEHTEADVWLLSITGEQSQMTDNGYLNYGATFSPQGDRVAYVSVRNNQSQVWLMEDGQERQVSRSRQGGRHSGILWSDGGNALAYKDGDKIFIYDLLAETETLLLENASNVTPLRINDGASESNEFEMLALKASGDVNNLWLLGDSSKLSKQLTFGSVGSAIAFGGDVYFQYTGQPGLWVWHKESNEVALLNAATSAFSANSKILMIDDSGVYFITGGYCRESSVFHVAFDSGELTTVLPRDNTYLSTESFHPRKGVLYTPCKLPESNIMVME